MRDLLHDETDALEAIQEEWRATVEDLKRDIRKIGPQTTDMRELLEEVLIRAANSLTEHTTKAVQSGLRFGELRAKKKDIGAPE